MSANRDAAQARIVLISPGQAETAGSILASSHADYPSFRHLFPDDQRRARGLRALFTDVARDAARLGSAYGALGDDGDLSGIALWLAPGKFPVGRPQAASRRCLDAVCTARTMRRRRTAAP
jgi:hypothetical protein